MQGERSGRQGESGGFLADGLSKERIQPILGGPLPQRGFYIDFGLAKETGPQGAGCGKTQAITGAAVMGTDGGDKPQFSLEAG